MADLTPTSRIAMAVNGPVAAWARLEVSGVETLPTSGPLLLVGNHDSHWDPVMIGHAARKRRMVRALAKSTLWDVRGLNKVLDGMGQIPIVRGAGDAQALANAVAALREGSCVGVFPEGTRSKGRVMRARSGVGRLALEVPEAHVSCVAISGTTDLTGFPHRPKIKVHFFDPAGGQPRADEDPGDLSARLLAEIRAISPPTISYRKRGKPQPAAGSRSSPCRSAAALEGGPGAAEGARSVALGVARGLVAGVAI